MDYFGSFGGVVEDYCWFVVGIVFFVFVNEVVFVVVVDYRNFW